MCHSIYSLTEHRLVDAILICESYHLQCNELSKSMRNRLDEISTIDAREWVIYPKQLAHTMVLNWLQYRYYTSYKARTPTLLQENACFGLDHKSCLIQFPYRRTKSIESRSIVEWFSSHARSPWINGRVSPNTDTDLLGSYKSHTILCVFFKSVHRYQPLPYFETHLIVESLTIYFHIQKASSAAAYGKFTAFHRKYNMQHVAGYMKRIADCAMNYQWIPQTRSIHEQWASALIWFLFYVCSCDELLLSIDWKLLYIFVGVDRNEDSATYERVQSTHRAVYNLLGFHSVHNQLHSYVTFVHPAVHLIYVSFQFYSRLKSNPYIDHLMETECAFRELHNAETIRFQRNQHVLETIRQMHKYE